MGSLFGIIQPEGGVPPELQRSMMINALLAGTGPLLQNTALPQNFGSRLSAALQNVYGAMGQQSAALQDAAMKQAQMQNMLAQNAHLQAQTKLAEAQAAQQGQPKPEGINALINYNKYIEGVRQQQQWPQRVADVMSNNKFPGQDAMGLAQNLLGMEPTEGNKMIADLTKEMSKESAKNAQSGVVENPTPGLTGESALQNYTPQVQTIARKLVKGEIPYPSAFALKDPLWKTIIQASSELDPTFNAQQYKVRESLRKSFTSGQDSRVINSINTLVGHLDSLSKSATALNNTGFTPYNTVANYILEKSDDPRITKFNMDVGAVENELSSVFKGTGATDQEIKAWRQRINSSQGPQQLAANIKEAVDLMGSRLLALRNKYETGMGPFNQFSILSPKARQILGNMMGEETVNQLEPPRQQESNQTQGTSAPQGLPQGARVLRNRRTGEIKIVDSQGNPIGG